MFFDNEVQLYKKEFNALKINDLETMKGILEVLDEIAEITYYIDKKQIVL